MTKTVIARKILDNAFYDSHGSGGVIYMLEAHEIDARKAAINPGHGLHSIWELVLHISACKDHSYRRLKGEKLEVTDEDQWPKVEDTSEAAWNKTLETMRERHKLLVDEFARQVESESRESDGFYDSLIENALHDMYHVGQMAILMNNLIAKTEK